MAEVTLKSVSKKYSGDIEAVKDVNLSITSGEFVVLVGPSGCGKSTTLRMIAGLEAITSGDVSIDGRRVNDVEPKNRDIAMVFQNYALYPQMSVYENMAFGLKMRGTARGEIDGRVREAAEILGIGDLLDRRPRALSGGQRQRVAVGRAIVRDPKVFLFDEPLSNLDAKLRVQMRAELVRLHRRLKATMIYVTHDQVEAMTMGDRIVIMNEGRIQQVASPMEIYQRPANRFVAEFIGSPPMNLIDGKVEQGEGEYVFRANDDALSIVLPEAVTRSLNGSEITLGLRPEDIRPNTGGDGVSLAAEVEVIEHMGAESIVYLRAGERTLTMRTSGDTEIPEDGEIACDINMKNALFFRTDNGERIG